MFIDHGGGQCGRQHNKILFPQRQEHEPLHEHAQSKRFDQHAEPQQASKIFPERATSSCEKTHAPLCRFNLDVDGASRHRHEDNAPLPPRFIWTRHCKHRRQTSNCSSTRSERSRLSLNKNDDFSCRHDDNAPFSFPYPAESQLRSG